MRALQHLDTMVDANHLRSEKMKRTIIIASLVFATFGAPPVLAQRSDPKGSAVGVTATLLSPSTWKNQRGSILEIKSVDAAKGTFAGTFTNDAAGFDCKGIPIDVIGYHAGNRVRFVANFKGANQDCRTLTVWRGHLTGTSMPTVWKLVYVTDKSLDFKHLNGSDTFKKFP